MHTQLFTLCYSTWEEFTVSSPYLSNARYGGESPRSSAVSMRGSLAAGLVFSPPLWARQGPLLPNAENHPKQLARKRGDFTIDIFTFFSHLADTLIQSDLK